VVSNPPLTVDTVTKTEPAKSLEGWLQENHQKLQGAALPMWDGVDFEVCIIGPNANLPEVSFAQETFYHQLKGSSVLATPNGDINLGSNSIVLLEPNTSHTLKQAEDSVCFRLTWHRK